MTTRSKTLVHLRLWNAPVAPKDLARWMNASPQHVGSNLSALYARGLCDRKLDVGYRKRFLYYPKGLQA